MRTATSEQLTTGLDGLEALIGALRARGYEVVGPRLRDGVIAYEPLEGAEDLPAGWTDSQDGGRYRLRRRDDHARFGYAVGPHSWKRYLLPARSVVFTAERREGGFALHAGDAQPARFAFLGVRPCDLAAIAVQDRVFIRDAMRDALYAARREDLFVVAVNCTDPAATCFCASMGTGPGARGGYDLALTELLDGAHRFVVHVASAAGAEVVAELPTTPAAPEDLAAAEDAVAGAAQRMGRHLEVEGLKDDLYANLEHPRWQAIAERCLGCGNCTMVCPTCFCTTVIDTGDITGAAAQRERVWDSCFTIGFSYIHGGSVRASLPARYRQWLTHKLATWIDQFGVSGCVGCGRCITWCPVGIDLTEEAAAIRTTPAQRESQP